MSVATLERPSRREFRAGKNLIKTVILRQAGSLEQAIGELVKNSIDSGSTRCEILIGNKTVHVVDDGTGMSREEIETAFETLGLEQTEAERARKTFGEFRMGRGQAFSQGVNRWRTATFEMVVDVASDDVAGYDLVDDLEPIEGCRVQIELYRPLDEWTVRNTKERLANRFKYASIKVLVNGDSVTEDVAASLLPWTSVTDDAYISARLSGYLVVYNQGILVASFPCSRFGFGGLVVTKRRIHTNFSCNEIMDSCPTWARIREQAESSIGTISLDDDLDDAGRCKAVELFLANRLPWKSFRNLPVFHFGNGKYGTLQVLANHLQRTKKRFAIADRVELRAELAERQRLAVVLVEDSIPDSDCDKSEIVFRILKHDSLPSGLRKRLSDSTFVNYHRLDVVDHPITHMSRGECCNQVQGWIRLIEPMLTQYGKKVCRTMDLVIGRRDGSWAWTDGQTFVAFNHTELSRRTFSVFSFVEVARTLLHELSHDKADTACHTHSPDFFEELDRLEGLHLATMVDQLVARSPSVAAEYGLRLSRSINIAVKDDPSENPKEIVDDGITATREHEAGRDDLDLEHASDQHLPGPLGSV